MTDAVIMSRFFRIRQKVLDEVERQRSNGEPGKMSDGDMFITYEIDHDGYERWTVTMYCYLIGPSRHYGWHGNTLNEALDRAEADIDEWIRAEVEREFE